jgi:hypothetical protein
VRRRNRPRRKEGTWLTTALQQVPSSGRAEKGNVAVIFFNLMPKKIRPLDQIHIMSVNERLLCCKLSQQSLVPVSIEPIAPSAHSSKLLKAKPLHFYCKNGDKSLKQEEYVADQATKKRRCSSPPFNWKASARKRRDSCCDPKWCKLGTDFIIPFEKSEIFGPSIRFI